MPAPAPSLYKRDLPDSQESYMSTASSTFSAPHLPSSSSNLSVSTTGDTEITSPPLSKTSSTQKTPAAHAIPPSPGRSRGPDATNAPRTGDTAAGPMSSNPPAMQGLKRAADGSPKGFDRPSNSTVAPVVGHKRTKSVEAGSNGRIGQVRDNSSVLEQKLGDES